MSNLKNFAKIFSGTRRDDSSALIVSYMWIRIGASLADRGGDQRRPRPVPRPRVCLCLTCCGCG